MWIDISHTVKAAELKGGKLFKHLHTGQTVLEGVMKLPDPPADPHFGQDVTEGLIPEIEATTLQSRKGKKRGS
jgi:hypothetical protein